MKHQPSHHIERMLVNECEAARLLSVSPRTMWAIAAAGEIRPIRIGRRVKRYDVQDLRDYVDSLKSPKEGGPDG